MCIQRALGRRVSCSCLQCNALVRVCLFDCFFVSFFVSLVAKRREEKKRGEERREGKEEREGKRRANESRSEQSGAEKSREAMLREAMRGDVKERQGRGEEERTN